MIRIQTNILFAKALAKVEAGEDPSIALGNREESGEDNELAEMLLGVTPCWKLLAGPTEQSLVLFPHM